MISSSTNKQDQQGLEILIRGTVQGVGFRPFVYNLASRLEITGSVANTGEGVLIKAYAQDERLSLFLESLQSEAPPLSEITSITAQPIAGPGEDDSFTILLSKSSDQASTAIPPDIAICDDCLRELNDPTDHRYLYPFINCTNCGPRFTIVETIPYDRPKTSMKVFPMCTVCEQQYNDPGDRRFHAQPNACGDCGPQLSWHDNKGNRIECVSPLAMAASAIKQDRVIAMRGLGGFHLTVNAHSQEAVRLLRERKGRPDKPLAVMMPDLDTINRYCHVSELEEKLLLSPAHPIVLLKRREESELAPNLAPEITELGVMLPYTPFQQLLFSQPESPDALVMTSGNASGAPICTANDDAIDRLQHIADFFLLHNRDIVTRVDDSVARIVGERQQIFRRARGYAPSPLTIGWKLPQIIGCGAGLKNTFALARDHSVFLSQHIGDLFNLESYDFYTESVSHLQKLLQLEPVAAACDLHPDYLSTHFANELGIELFRVQHHHAHAVAVMAEHNLDEQVLALVLDGTGYGTDRTIWGGEILSTTLTDFTRLAHLEEIPLPGGDVATSEPWRLGLALLYRLNNDSAWDYSRLPSAMQSLEKNKIDVVNAMITNGFNSPMTSSCGRLFDGVASLLGIRQQVSYEGQAAIELEAAARKAATANWFNQIPDFSSLASPSILYREGEKWKICSAEFVKLLLAAHNAGYTKERIALQFHYLLISSISELIHRLSAETGIRKVVLAGGCLQNSLLLEGFSHTLKANNLEIFTGEKMPVNDGAISLGQTIIGGLQYVSRHSHAGN